jgi:hypothetical protein
MFMKRRWISISRFRNTAKMLCVMFAIFPLILENMPRLAFAEPVREPPIPWKLPTPPPVRTLMFIEKG